MKEGKPKLCYDLSGYSEVSSGETLGQTGDLFHSTSANFKRTLTSYASIIIFQPKVNEAHKENLLPVQS